MPVLALRSDSYPGAVLAASSSASIAEPTEHCIMYAACLSQTLKGMVLRFPRGSIRGSAGTVTYCKIATVASHLKRNGGRSCRKRPQVASED